MSNNKSHGFSYALQASAATTCRTNSRRSSPTLYCGVRTTLTFPPFTLHIHKGDHDLIEHDQSRGRNLQKRLASVKQVVCFMQFRYQRLFTAFRHKLRIHNTLPSAKATERSSVEVHSYLWATST